MHSSDWQVQDPASYQDHLAALHERVLHELVGHASKFALCLRMLGLASSKLVEKQASHQSL